MDCSNDNLLCEDFSDKYGFIAPDGQEYMGTTSYVITPYMYNNFNLGTFERNRAILNARGFDRDVYISPMNNGWRLQDEDTNFESFITENVD